MQRPDRIACRAALGLHRGLSSSQPPQISRQLRICLATIAVRHSLCSLVPRVVHKGAHWPHTHTVHRERLKQVPQRLTICVGRVKPRVIVMLVEQYGHAIVDLDSERVCVRGDNRAATPAARWPCGRRPTTFPTVPRTQMAGRRRARTGKVAWSCLEPATRSTCRRLPGSGVSSVLTGMPAW